MDKEENYEDIMSYDEAIYMDIAAPGEESQIELVNIGTTKFDESSNPTEKSTQYIGQKSKTNIVTGYDNQFSMENDLIKNVKVLEALEKIFDRRLTGKAAQRDVFVVKLWKPIADQANSFEAKKIRVSCVMSDKSRTPGENIKLNGTLKGVGDFEYGTFDTNSKTFTAETSNTEE